MEIREKYSEERFQGPSILFFRLRVTDAHPLRETHAIPLLGDQLTVDGLVGAAEQGWKRTVVAVGINPVDAPVLDTQNAGAEA